MCVCMAENNLLSGGRHTQLRDSHDHRLKRDTSVSIVLISSLRSVAGVHSYRPKRQIDSALKKKKV